MADIQLDEDTVSDFLDMFNLHARAGRDLEETRQKLSRWRDGSEAEFEEAYNRQRMALGFINPNHQIGAYKRERQGKNWFRPNLDADVFWPKLRESIEADLGDAIHAIDDTSTAVINGLRPHTEVQHTKGLVLGHVQSGKTTNYLSVIAKAADAGFRLIIVLTGITENLRQQTQARIDSQLVGPQSHRWHRLTSAESDFSGDDNVGKLKNENDRFIAVVKKNSARLQRLNQWLNGAADIAHQCPILVIDDESDQASIDVSPQSREERSAINRQINHLLEYDITAYVAYTATPFANILIDPNKTDDLYPSDFLVTLPEPKGYFGSRALFGREALDGEDPDQVESEGYDMIRIIPEDEVEGIRPGGKSEPDKTVTGGDELLAAIRWFVMATAARRHRGQTDKHSSMLIHTSMLTDDHDDLRIQVENEIVKLRNSVSRESEIPSVWRKQWENETERVPAETFGLIPVLFEQISPSIPEVLRDLSLIVDNGSSDERLEYTSGPKTVIAIGGNTLSRGLTLEGLVSSYFVRRASAYDTLLQMGRWFGFRNGYQDLPRIWMPEELSGWFHDLSTVEAELREELDVYVQEQRSPIEIQAKIRQHPDMVITSRAKMQDAVEAEMSFQGKKEQTIKFQEKNLDWLQRNLRAVEELVSDIKKRGIEEQVGAYESPVFLKVDNSVILDFLERYQIHADTRLGKNSAELLKKYIRKESISRRLRHWNVSFITQDKDRLGSIELGLNQPVALISRAKLAKSKPNEANIKALVTTKDRLNDVIRATEDERLEFRQGISQEILDTGGHQESVVRKNHEKHVGAGIGHLAIYPIAKNSAPRPNSKTEGQTATVRTSLDAVEHVMGIGIFFPSSESNESAVNYVSAKEPKDSQFLDEYKAAAQEVSEIRQQDEAEIQKTSDDTFK